jgi:hypothetical protein
VSSGAASTMEFPPGSSSNIHPAEAGANFGAHLIRW